jgi:hypothetical protein
MEELDAIKKRYSRVWYSDATMNTAGRHPPLPWITPRKDLRYLRAVVKKTVAAAGLRNQLSFTSFRHDDSPKELTAISRMQNCAPLAITGRHHLCQAHA